MLTYPYTNGVRPGDYERDRRSFHNVNCDVRFGAYLWHILCFSRPALNEFVCASVVFHK